MLNHAAPVSGQVHLWPLALDPPESEQGALEQCLSADELQRAAGYRFARDRTRFCAGRAQLRRVLGGYLDTDPSRIRFAYGERGKPALDGPALAFNLSHSGSRALCAVTGGSAVGVDLEWARPVPNLRALAATIMSPLERLLFDELPTAEQMPAFYRCWTRKEACLKVRGEGISESLKRISVSLIDELFPRLLHVDPAMDACADWTVCSPTFATDYFAAVVLAGRIDSVIWKSPWPEQTCSVLAD